MRNFVLLFCFLLMPAMGICDEQRWNWQPLRDALKDPSWDKVIVWKDGRSAGAWFQFVITAYTDDVRFYGKSEEQFFKEWAANGASQTIRGGPCVLLDRKDLPPFAYREAWEFHGKGIKVNMEKARAIHWAYLKAMRSLKLQHLDVEFFKASENYGLLDLLWYREVEKVKRDKQILRDIPQVYSLEGIQTPEELVQAIPEPLMDVAEEVFSKLTNMEVNSDMWQFVMFQLDQSFPHS